MIFFNKWSKGLTMQINFHSLLWSYLPKVPIFLAMTDCTHTHTHYARNISWMHWNASSVMYPGIIGCFGSRNIIHPRPGDPARVDQAPTYVPVAIHGSALLIQSHLVAFSAASLADWMALLLYIYIYIYCYKICISCLKMLPIYAAH